MLKNKGEYQHGIGSKTTAYTPTEYRSIQAEVLKFTHTFEEPANEPQHIYIEPQESCRVRIQPRSDVQLRYTLYKDSDVDPSTGQSINRANTHLVSSRDPDLANVLTETTIDDTGEEIVDLQLSGQQNGPGGSDNGTPSDIGPDTLGWIIDSSTPLLIELEAEDSDFITAVVNVEKHVQKY